MRNKALSSRTAMATAIVLALGAAVLWPWRMADGGDTPDRSRTPGTPLGNGRRAASFADRAGGLGRRHAPPDRQPDRRNGVTGRSQVRGACSTRSRPATSLRAWPSRKTAVAAVVTHWYGYDIGVLEIKDDKIELAGRVEVGPEPRGVALTADGTTAYVAVGVTNEVARVDLSSRKVTGRLPVGREPRGIALTPDESRLLVGNARSQNVSLIDVKTLDGQEHHTHRRRQPAAGGHQCRRQDRLYRQHAAIAGFRRPATISTSAGSSASA